MHLIGHKYYKRSINRTTSYITRQNPLKRMLSKKNNRLFGGRRGEAIAGNSSENKSILRRTQIGRHWKISQSSAGHKLEGTEGNKSIFHRTQIGKALGVGFRGFAVGVSRWDGFLPRCPSPRFRSPPSPKESRVSFNVHRGCCNRQASTPKPPGFVSSP